MTLSDRCEREVVAFHEFLEEWMGGDAVDDDATGLDDSSFDRAEVVLPDDFEMVSPSGERRDGAAVRADLRDARGAFAASDPPFRVRVANPRTRFEGAGRCLVTYEEWQRVDGDWEGRYSSALFRRRPDAPNGVAWHHLHETWLPEGTDPPAP